MFLPDEDKYCGCFSPCWRCRQKQLFLDDLILNLKTDVMLKQGMIVTYHCTAAEKDLLNNYQNTCPAMIVTAWGDNPGAACNLRVFYDGATVGWKTSVSGNENSSGNYYSVPTAE